MKLDNPFEFKPARPQPARPAHAISPAVWNLPGVIYLFLCHRAMVSPASLS